MNPKKFVLGTITSGWKNDISFFYDEMTKILKTISTAITQMKQKIDDTKIKKKKKKLDFKVNKCVFLC